MGAFVPHIPDWFDTRRAAQVVAYFGRKAGGRINILRAAKLVYLADRLSMERREYPTLAIISFPCRLVRSIRTPTAI